MFVKPLIDRLLESVSRSPTKKIIDQKPIAFSVFSAIELNKKKILARALPKAKEIFVNAF